MKRLFLLMLCYVAATAALFAQEDLQQAENFYRQGRYSAALSAYENCLKTHPNDPFVYYNIGNCYFKMGSKGLAAANYYRAFRLAPRDNDIRHNLTLALADGGERLVPSGVPVSLHKLFFGLSHGELKGFTYGLWWLWCILVSAALLRRKGYKAVIVCSICVLISAVWLWARHQVETEPLAVVAAPAAEIRSGPGTNFPASANVAQGHLVTLLDSKDAWYQVIVTSQGIKGWIEKSAVEKI